MVNSTFTVAGLHAIDTDKLWSSSHTDASYVDNQCAYINYYHHKDTMYVFTIPDWYLPLVEEAAVSVAAIFAFRSADERMVAGMFVWAARDWTTPDEAFNSADCNWSCN